MLSVFFCFQTAMSSFLLSNAPVPSTIQHVRIDFRGIAQLFCWFAYFADAQHAVESMLLDLRESVDGDATEATSDANYRHSWRAGTATQFSRSCVPVS